MRRQRQTPADTKAAVGYVRVSTADQAQEGVSLQAQRDRIASWCSANGYTLLAVHEDAGLSGKRADNRPALQLAIKAACDQGAALVAYSLSRVGRSVVDLHQIAGRLDKAGAAIVSLSESLDTSSAAGRMIFGMLSVLSAFERDLGSERTAFALASKRSRGERISRHAPFGFRYDGGMIVKDEAEAAVLARVRSMRASGVSFRTIRDTFNVEGVPARGQRWHLRSVQLAAEAAA